MGEDVAAKVFSREDRQRYRQKVRPCLDVFARMLSEARFEAEPRSVGLEIELNGVPDSEWAAFKRMLERTDPDFAN